MNDIIVTNNGIDSETFNEIIFEYYEYGGAKNVDMWTEIIKKEAKKHNYKVDDFEIDFLIEKLCKKGYVDFGRVTKDYYA